MTWKQRHIKEVMAVATRNTNIEDPGKRIDDVVLRPGDAVLLPNQIFTDENGIWLWQAPHVPMLRWEHQGPMAVTPAHGLINLNTLWEDVEDVPD